MRDRTVPELFADHVAATPDAVAVEYGERRLSYAELDACSNQMARLLESRGAGPGVFVGVRLERDLEFVVTALAVLKLGGAYVPLDPEYPAHRVAFILKDTEAPVLVSSGELAGDLTDFQGHQVLVDQEREDLQAASAEPLGDCLATAASLAYVIYTSGSTGQPKGVCVPHRGIVRLVRDTDYVHLKSTDRIAQLANTSFDAATFEIWGPLLNGARLVGITKDLALDAERMAETLRGRGITTLFVTTALFNQLVRGRPDVFATLDTLLFGGEAVDPRWVRTVLEQGPPKRLLHVYGPTENTTFSTWHLVEAVEPDAKTVPIGRAIARSQAVVVDDLGQPSSVGEPGELLVLGDGLATGYLNRPELTAEQFVAYPPGSGTRAYRTGDRVRLLEDGAIEFVGRNDNQIKLRGFRIELGEIEFALLQDDAVKECAVLVRSGAEDEPGNRQIVAYVVSEAGACADEIHARLAEYLPAHMIPAAFAFVDKMPLNQNGKVDQQALLAIEVQPVSRAEFVPPETSTEKTLAAIWQELLGVERVGIHDDFFELGGHSLLGAQLLNRIREQLDIQLPPQQLFERPTLAELAQCMEEARQNPHTTSGIERVALPIRLGGLPLTFSQERAWFLQQLDADSIAYQAQAVLHFRGSLDVAVLERALSEIVWRHEIFRTTFPVRDGSPVQQIHPAWTVELPVVDVASVADPAEREAEYDRVVTETLRKGFDLTRLPLARWVLVRVGPEDNRLIHVEHHLIHDGWSFCKFLNELAALYTAFVKGEESPLPELRAQFGDFAAWQRQWMEQEEARAQLRFWTESMADAPEELELPLDRPRPATQSFQGAALRFDLPAELIDAARELARQQGVTLFMTMLAAFDVLLHRYSGQDDICVGSGVANRRLPESEPIMGMIINTIVFRARLDGDVTVGELLQRVRENTVGAYTNQDYPFDRVVNAVRPTRDLSRNPLFQALFGFHDSPMPDLELPGVTIEVEEALNNGSAKFDMVVLIIPRSEQLKGHRGSAKLGTTVVWEYNSALFDRETIEAMSDQYRDILQAMAKGAQQTIAELTPLRDDQRQRLLVDFNDTDQDYPRHLCVHQLFHKQAVRTPDRVAVTDESGAITYAELRERASELARRLRHRGVGPGAHVGVCVQRNRDLLVALLGVMESGAAYVPLDPSFPPERLRGILEDSGSRFVVADDVGATVVAEFDGELLRVGEQADASQAPAPEAADEVRRASPEDPAYLIYTSGSTGRPKGVAVLHRAVVNFLCSMAGKPGLHEDELLLPATTLAFDISGLELFLPLTVGARVEIVTRDVAIDGHRLAERIASSGATVLQATPATWQMLLDAGWSGDGRLKMLCGGEALPRALAEELLTRGGELWNMYGPTETTIWSAIDRVLPGADQAITIGRPIANTQLFVLDPKFRPVPLGVTGELYIGGDGLALCYHDRAELTEERFVRDAMPGLLPSRLYRTGDRVRYDLAGSLHFLGRVDHQIKLRGFRIEPGEVENVLLKSPLVSEAVVVVREDGPNGTGGKRLVAYVVAAAAGAILDDTELRSFVKARLPAYMVPSDFVTLESLPVNASGKIDRRALPAPARSAEGGAEYVAPEGPTEQLVASCWSGILGVERIGRNDEFFELGGHSLLATRVGSRIRELFGVELPIVDLFEHATVADFARRVDHLRENSEASSAPPLEPLPEGEPAPLSFGQQRFHFVEQLHPGSSALNIPVSIRMRGALDVDALERALTEIMRRHATLRTSFPVGDDGQPFPLISQPGEFGLSKHDLTGLAEGERWGEAERRANDEARAPFDITRGPLVRAQLLVLSEADFLLLFTMHHIVSDGWSLGIFRRELAASYSAFAAGGISPLPELPIQYQDFAHWQRSFLDDARLGSLLDYWKGCLEGAPPVLELPTDRPRSALQTSDATSESLELDATLSRGLHGLAASNKATLFMVLLAGFEAVLHRYTGQSDLVIGTPIAGRTRARTEGLIGFFVNSLVLRTDLSNDPSFSELIARTRKVALGAYTHQDLPFERLVQELQSHRDASHHPLFQVAFSLQNAPQSQLRLPGLELEWLLPSRFGSQFELALNAKDAGDRIKLRADYRIELFDASTIRRMLGHLEHFLHQALAHPDRPLSQLSLLSEPERQTLAEWGGRPSAYPRDKSVVELFAEQVEARPGTVAVEYGSRSLTYAELDRRSNQLARVLESRGAGPGVFVGVRLARDLEFVVTLLAILKTGGVYVPLDSDYPKQRVAYILEDTGAPVLVSSEAFAADIADFAGQKILIDTEKKAIDAAKAEPLLSHRATAESLAYVIYTSGSTGKPKGVCVPHRAIVRLVSDTDYVNLDANDRVAQASNTSFDAATFEIWGALLNGARLVGIPKDVALDAERMAATLRDESVTTLFVTTALFNQLVRGRPDVFATLDTLLFGGESVDPRWVRTVLERGRPKRLLHVYGPTENTTFSTWHEVTGVEPGATTVPIGRPIANTQAVVADEHGELSSIGVAGELLLLGDGLATGYLNAEALTDERFVAFPKGSDAVAYRTGDRVRWLETGTLEFLGRDDGQIKLRGFRIELGEIEFALGLDDAVKECVVLLREDESGDRRIVAYVVPEGGADAADANRIREGLEQSLPTYMTPSAFVFLDEMPLNPNGKVDHRALLAIEVQREAGAEFVAPETPMEKELASIWEELLGVERVGVYDEFFELGGHSLLAMQLTNRIQDEFNIEVSLLPVMFQGGTIAALVERINALHQARDDQGAGSGTDDIEELIL